MIDTGRSRMANPQLLAALPAFEASARLQSITKAARELGISQSAMSRRIATLESGLGLTLFARRGRNLVITADGLSLANTASEALKLIERARVTLNRGCESRLRVGALPSIAGLWLAPRLPGFLAQYPGLRCSVTAIEADFSVPQKDPVNWDPSVLDVTLTWGRGGWRSLRSKKLIEERMIPVCSPALAHGSELLQPSDLTRLPRLNHSTRSGAWEGYFRAYGVQDIEPSLPTLDLEHFYMLREAALAGAGIALLPTIFVSDDLATGRLTAPLPYWRTGGSYAAVFSPAALLRKPVAQFVEWLTKEARN